VSKFSTYAATASAIVMMGLGTGAAIAQSGADFFNGKTINYIVGTDPGGVYDTNGRLVAEFMQKHLPGSTFVVRNMAGAGGIISANFIYGSSPDGLTIGTFNTGLIYAQLSENPALRLNLSEMSWIGKVASDPRVLVVSERSSIESFEDLQNLKTPVKFATCGVGCASMLESTMLINSFELPVELVSGYGGNEDQMALRRGEVLGLLGSRSEFEPFVAEGHGKFIAQIGGSQTDIPQLSSFADNDNELGAVTLVASQGELSRFTAGPPGIPEDRLAALRDAYAAATSDPEFLAKAATLGLPVDPLVGKDVSDAVIEALNQTPAVVDFLKQALEKH
jgi:tripartite-type tricarboxylate transporter receptor subunit TctC